MLMRTQVRVRGVKLEQKAPRNTSGLKLKPSASYSLQDAAAALYSAGKG